MAAAAAAVALNQQAVITAFMRADAVRPSEAIVFEPKGSIQRSFFRDYTKAGIIKPEGVRWYLSIPAYHAYKKRQKRRVAVAGGVLAAVAGIALLL